MENYINLKIFFRNLPLIQFHSSFNRIVTEDGRVYSSEVHEGPPVLVWEVWSGIWKILHQSCSFRVQNKVKNDLNSFESRQQILVWRSWVRRNTAVKSLLHCRCIFPRANLICPQEHQSKKMSGIIYIYKARCPPTCSTVL